MSTYIIDFKSHKTKCKTSLNTTSNWSSKIWRFTTWSIWRFYITLWYNFMYTSLYKTNYLTDFHWKRIWSAPAQYTSKWPAHLQDLFSFKSCTWRGSSTFKILAAEISYIHCNPIQSTKPQFRIFFPQYAVTPTSRGLERNTYLVHANARRLIKLNKKSLNYKVEQKFVLTFICSSPVVTIDLLTWQLDCVNGNCENYPGIPMTLAKLLKKTIRISKWASKKQLVTTKRVQKEYFFFVHRNNHNGRSHRTLEKI